MIIAKSFISDKANKLYECTGTTKRNWTPPGKPMIQKAAPGWHFHAESYKNDGPQSERLAYKKLVVYYEKWMTHK